MRVITILAETHENGGMQLTADERRQRMAHFVNELKRNGIKLTQQRMEVFRELLKSQDHPDAEAIFKAVRKRMPTISQDTVYRTMWMLLDIGLIGILNNLHAKTRFDANISAHHHFICVRCGIARDFVCEELDNFPLSDAVASLGIAQNTRVEVKGLCLRCSKGKVKQPI